MKTTRRKANGQKNVGMFQHPRTKYPLIASFVILCMSCAIYVAPRISYNYNASVYNSAQKTFAVAEKKGNYALAARNYEIMIDKSDQMRTGKSSQSYLSKIQAYNYVSLGQLHYQAKDYLKAQAAYATSIEHYQALSEAKSNDDMHTQYETGLVYYYMAQALCDDRNYPAVHEYIALAKPYVERFVSDENYRSKSLALNYSLAFYEGEAFKMQREYARAIEAHERGLESAQKLVELDSDYLKYQDYLSIAYRELGRDYAAMDDINAARDNFEQAIFHAAFAVEKSQTPYAYERSLMYAHYNLALLSDSDEDEQYMKAFEILKSHQESNRLHDNDVYEFNYLQKRFARQAASIDDTVKALRGG